MSNTTSCADAHASIGSFADAHIVVVAAFAISPWCSTAVAEFRFAAASVRVSICDAVVAGLQNSRHVIAAKVKR